MKITAKIKLLPTPEQHELLLSTLRKSNECATWLSAQAWSIKNFNYFALAKAFYGEAKKRFGLNSQLTVRVFAKVADAYKVGRKVERKFHPFGCVAFDDRILRYREGNVINIWTTGGRQTIPYIAGPEQVEKIKKRQGQSGLLYRNGNWFLAVICNTDEPEVKPVTEWLGVDMGVANIATDSDGGNFSGDAIKGVRFRNRRLRTKLQKKGTRGCRRKLRELSGREKRFAANTNHIISKQIVAKAEGTGRGIALEDLRYIRTRITAGRKQRAVLHSWAFWQLRAFIEYKAKIAGIPVIVVDPRNSSRECSECGHISKSNRPDQATFSCQACGHSQNADINASRVISGRAATSRPNVAQNTAAAS